MGGKKAKSDDISKSVLDDIKKGSKILEDSNKRLVLALQHYEEKVAKLEKELDSIKKKYKPEVLENAEAKQKQFERRAVRLEKNLLGKQKIVDHLHKKLDIARVNLHDAINEKKRVERELKSRNKAFDQLHNALHARKKEMDLSKEVTVRLQEKEIDYKQNVRKVESMLRGQADRLKKYEEIVTALTKQITEYKSREKVFAKQMLLHRKNANEKEKEASRAREEKAVLETEVESLEFDKKKIESEKRTLGKEILKNRKEITDLSIQKNIHEDEIKAKDEAIAKLQEP